MAETDATIERLRHKEKLAAATVIISLVVGFLIALVDKSVDVFTEIERAEHEDGTAQPPAPQRMPDEDRTHQDKCYPGLDCPTEAQPPASGVRDYHFWTSLPRNPFLTSVVTASRIFAGPNQYPPSEFSAYGILAFPSRPSPYDRNRYLMICNAYIATLAHASELEVTPAKQIVTVWPIESDLSAARLNVLPFGQDQTCQIAVDSYGIVIAQRALKDAQLAGVDTIGIGPFLLAWSPSIDKGRQDALVLVSDLSDITTYGQAHEMFLDWSHDIEHDPRLWSNGWNLERLRKNIRFWVDKYGAKSLAVFGVKG